MSYFQQFLTQQCFQYSTVFIWPMNKENIPLSNESSSTICSPRKLAVSLLLFILWEILLSHGSYKTVIPKIFYWLIVSKNGSPRKPAVSFLFKRIVPKEYVHKPIYIFYVKWDLTFFTKNCLIILLTIFLYLNVSSKPFFLNFFFFLPKFLDWVFNLKSCCRENFSHNSRPRLVPNI